MKQSDFWQFPFFKDMDEEDKNLLVNGVIRKELDQGQIMVGDNQRCTGIPLLLKGTLRVFRISDKGREMTLYRINQGELCILAAVCAMGDVEYDFSIEAQTESKIANIPPDVFKELLYKSEVFKTYIFNTLAQKLIMSIETIEMLIFVSIEDRIIEYLQENANERGEVITTHEKMAIDLGSSREVITRQLKKMADKQKLQLKRGKIILK